MPLLGVPRIEKLQAAGDVDGLIKALAGDRRPKVRAEAARALGTLGVAGAVEPLLMVCALPDELGEVKREATEALVKIASSEVEPLTRSLLQSRGVIGPGVRLTAARVLGQLGHPEAVEPLIAALLDEVPDVGREAAEALIKIGPAAVGPLAGTLQHGSAETRRAAVAILGTLRDASAVEPLIAGLGHSDTVVRERAAAALGDLRDPRAIEPLIAAVKDAKDNVRAAAAKSLAGFGHRAVDALTAVIESEEGEAKEAAARALQRIRGPEARAALERLVPEAAEEQHPKPNGGPRQNKATGGRGQKETADQALARWYPPPWGKCDICSDAIGPQGRHRGHRVPNREFRELVALGYDPFASGRAQAGEASTWGADAAVMDVVLMAMGASPASRYEEWKSRVVFTDTTDWGLCRLCAADLADFLARR